MYSELLLQVSRSRQLSSTNRVAPIAGPVKGQGPFSGQCNTRSPTLACSRSSAYLIGRRNGVPLLTGGAIEGWHQRSLAGQGLNGGKLIRSRDDAWFPRDRIHADHRSASGGGVGTRLGTTNQHQGKCAKAEYVWPSICGHNLSSGELLRIVFRNYYSSVERRSSFPSSGLGTSIPEALLR